MKPKAHIIDYQIIEWRGRLGMGLPGLILPNVKQKTNRSRQDKPVQSMALETSATH